MAGIFDRDTLLDLTVNVIPLGIILFFVVVFLVLDPFAGLGEFGQLLSMGLLVFPFVALALLTYISGKAIAGDEQRSAVFFQGQATLDDAPTRHEAELAAEGESVSSESSEAADTAGDEDATEDAEATDEA